MSDMTNIDPKLIEEFGEDVIKQVLADTDESTETTTPDGDPSAEDTDVKEEVADNEQEEQQPESEIPVDKQKYVPLQALHEEREKRQKLQSDFEELKKIIIENQQKMLAGKHEESVQEPEESDPLALLIQEQLEKVLPKHLQPVQEVQRMVEETKKTEALKHKVLSSESNARQKYSDYDDVIKPFQEIVVSNPELQKFLLSAEDPADLAYTMALGMQAKGNKQAPKQDKSAKKLDKVAEMPRTAQLLGSNKADEMNLEQMIDNFDKLTPEQQEKITKIVFRR